MGAESLAAGLDTEQVARVLLDRGSVREASALLAGAVARDHREIDCARLLDEVRADRRPPPLDPAPPLTLELVDRWIRRGMLVEALALLGGTDMGSEETGREWANLLGELLAPVPVDAEPALVEMHANLLRGGASVALVLLGERAGREPALPAWAMRRLELLHWMLLDNARTAERHPELALGAPTALATAVREAVNHRNLRGALEAARARHAVDPSDPDPPAVARAVEAILREIERHADDGLHEARTLPMLGRPSASMQLRMGNLEQAAKVYRSILGDEPSDAHAESMLGHVEALLRAAAGEPVVDTWGAETVLHDDDDTSDTEPPPGHDATNRMPTAGEHAARLIALGQLEEAERLLRGLASAFPDDTEWPRRVRELAALRDGDGSVLVRVIRSVK